MTRKMVLYTCVICLALALPVLAATYEFKTINPFSSVDTSARGINDAGDVVGDFATVDDGQVVGGGAIEHGFLRHQGKYTQLDFPGSFDTDANGIAENGVIVGTYAAKLLDGSRGADHGYVLDKHGYHALPDPPTGFQEPDFNAVNEEGDVVGGMKPTLVATGNRGFLLDDGHYVTIDCGHDQTEANGINDDGDIVGECTDFISTNTEHGFLLRNGKFYLIDAPGAVCGGTIANGISESGDIVGIFGDANCIEHGFVLKNFPKKPTWKVVERAQSTSPNFTLS